MQVPTLFNTSHLTHAQVFFVATWAIVLSNDPASLGWGQYHPLLQSLAIACFSYGTSPAHTPCRPLTPLTGILTLQPTSQPHTKAAGLVRHQIAMGLGGTFILLGAVAMFVNKNSHGAAHFTTWHGVGARPFAPSVVSDPLPCRRLDSSVSCGSSCRLSLGVRRCGLAALRGAGVPRPRGCGSITGNVHRRVLARAHVCTRVSGYVLFPVILLTSHLGGGWSSWVVHHSDEFVRLVAYSVAPLLILAGVYSRVR